MQPGGGFCPRGPAAMLPLRLCAWARLGYPGANIPRLPAILQFLGMNRNVMDDDALPVDGALDGLRIGATSSDGAVLYMVSEES